MNQTEDYHEAILQKLQTVLSKLKVSRAVPDEDSMHLGKPVPRPGSFYQRYQSESQLSERARLFFEAAAQLVGLSLRTLVVVVSQTEHKLQLWEEGIRRGKSQGKDPAEEPDMDEEEMVIEDETMAVGE
jgi:RNA polymerase I-specific transcription initiation factor RRN7